ncbi:hypothetical protein OJ996_03600 [Luteolibacter sp. GHJ8]|uniref:Uncharacterized protein n=1 Tax=Luteolibacter rhizosphaerae TaxID=2989719 RepID=A0ABT3FYI7_9BACT|nr:hypothetical protein [Luteolibacter rhizosphaerae]MCW1912645.1 hypothetical protein [Luteolibacter rhizosphaerae]
MSEKRSHPLSRTLSEWAEGATPVVPFAPSVEEFRKLIDLPNDYWLLAAPTAKRRIAQTYFRSKYLGLALCGRACPVETHELIYLAAAGNSRGFALVDAAFYAWELGPVAFAKFGLATQLEGFLSALEDWTRVYQYAEPYAGLESSIKAIEPDAPIDPEEKKYWLHAALEHSASADAFADSVADIQRRKVAAETRKKKRGTNRKAPEFLNFVAFGWLPRSFWTMTADEILWKLGGGNDAVRSSERIKRDISRLGFGNSHRSDYGAVLAKIIEDA